MSREKNPATCLSLGKPRTWFDWQVGVARWRWHCTWCGKSKNILLMWNDWSHWEIESLTREIQGRCIHMVLIYHVWNANLVSQSRFQRNSNKEVVDNMSFMTEKANIIIVISSVRLISISVSKYLFFADEVQENLSTGMREQHWPILSSLLQASLSGMLSSWSFYFTKNPNNCK